MRLKIRRRRIDRIELMRSVRVATGCNLSDAKPLADFIWDLHCQNEMLSETVISIEIMVERLCTMQVLSEMNKLAADGTAVSPADLDRWIDLLEGCATQEDKS